MATEVCAICKKESTPWYWLSDIKEHICVDCYEKESEHERR